MMFALRKIVHRRGGEVEGGERGGWGELIMRVTVELIVLYNE